MAGNRMNKFLTLSLMGLASAGAFAQFTIDNLVVLRVGDGSAALTNASTAVTLDQFTQSGSSVNSTSFTNLTLSGSATSEGSLYNYGSGLSFGGYGVAAGTASVVGTASSAVKRSAVSVSFAGGAPTIAPLTMTPTSPFSANNIRGVAMNGPLGPNNVPTRIIAVGANTGVVNADLSGASQVASSNIANIRVVQTVGDDVYYSTGSNTQGVYKVTGGATGTGITSTLVFSAGGGSIYDFQLLSDGDYLFADDSGVSGGLKRWDFATNTISTIAAPSIFGSSISLRHFVTRGNSLFATTTESNNNRIVRLDFSGSETEFTGTVSISDIAFAGTNRVFRGIEAVPEPASMAVLGLGILGLARRRRNK